MQGGECLAETPRVGGKGELGENGPKLHGTFGGELRLGALYSTKSREKSKMRNDVQEAYPRAEAKEAKADKK